MESLTDPSIRAIALELTKHRGEWVAIKGSRVVVSAATPTEVLRQVNDRGIVGWVLDHVSEDPNTIYIL